MKASLPGSLFSLAARRAARTSGGKTLDIFKNVRLAADDGVLVLDSSDDLSWLTQRFLCAREMQPGATCVEASGLAKAAEHFGSETSVNFEQQDTKLVLSAGRKKLKLPTIDASDFPNRPALPRRISSVPAAPLFEAMAEVAHARCKDSTRPIFGVFVETKPDSLRVVATDGHRLALSSRVAPCGEELSFVIPGGASELLPGLFREEEKLSFGTTESHFVCHSENVSLYSLLSSGSFPSYSQLLEELGTLVATVGVSELQAALALVRVSEERARLTIAPERVVIEPLDDREAAHVECDVQFTGTPIVVGISARYLAEAVAAFCDQDAELVMSSALEPVVVRAKDSQGSMALIMPTRTG